MKLIIVESPTKAKTIKKFLNKDFIVESSFGHIRDLPKTKLGIDIENNFKPEYKIPKDKQKIIKKLKELSKKAETIYLATDEDREGEAISWHLMQALNLDPQKTKRITFHEITKSAILKALEHPRNIDDNLVNAQQARRILDRLVGYKLSPFLWKKIVRGLSAGRVQSVAVRLIVEREREIEKFKPKEYWTINAIFNYKDENIQAELYKIQQNILKKFDIKTKEQAQQILDKAKKQKYKITKIQKKKIKKSPKPPFTTSTLQQAASTRLNFSPKQTMRIAQQLYEGIELNKNEQIGLITYMRTDSVNLSEQFLQQSEKFIKQNFGKQYFTQTRIYKTKSKNAQEAHEAIRPTNLNLTPDKIKNALTEQQYKLYKLIWQRAIGSQMSDAEIEATIVEITSGNQEFTFKATGSVIVFDGFMKLYPTETKDKLLPKLKENTNVDLHKITTDQHFTKPPARYTEASLIKTLEKYGIGRPSTYAPIISTIQERNYVVKKQDKRLYPTEMAFIVNDLLVEHFTNIVDFNFTAQMEENLDKIALGKQKWQKVLADFYFPFEENIKQKEKQIDKKNLTEEKINEQCEKCGAQMVIKLGRYGKFKACSNFPKCKFTKPLDELEPEEQKLISNEICEKCGKPMELKTGKFGKFLGCSGYPECKNIKPIVKSLGIQCPKCKKGQIIEKKTKSNKLFYSCDRYPDCDFALWQKPTGEFCEKCKSLLIYNNKNNIKCSNKDCS